LRKQHKHRILRCVSFGGNYVGAGVGGIWYQATSAGSDSGNCVVVGRYIMGWRILDFVIAMGSFGDSFGVFVVNLVEQNSWQWRSDFIYDFIRNLSTSCLSIVITVH